jgi:hypothetical protein
MRYILFYIAFIIFGLVLFNNVLAVVLTEHIVNEVKVEEVVVEKPVEVALKAPIKPVVQRKDPTPSQAQLILQKSAEYGVDPVVMIDVIRCESGFIEDVQSRLYYKTGGREQSYGLVQIHLPHHPTVTYEQAIDPEFAIDFLARHLSEGKGYLWTCHRNLLASR